MSIDVLAADERGDENVQRWLASGLPVPPSWRISRQAVLEQDTDGLVRRLRALPRMFNGERYWVLHQGAMNAESQRESLLNLDSDEALAAALTTVFGRDPAPVPPGCCSPATRCVRICRTWWWKAWPKAAPNGSA